jgi:hypothetical protein
VDLTDEEKLIVTIADALAWFAVKLICLSISHNKSTVNLQTVHSILRFGMVLLSIVAPFYIYINAEH